MHLKIFFARGDLVNLTVVIPALNEEKYIERTLQSLKEQSVNIEIIVVDNGSNDKTIEISQKIADKSFSYTKRKGPLFAANYGFKHAKGDIIAMAGADCVYPSKWAERVLKAFKSEEIVGVYGPIRFFDSNFLMNFLSGLFYEIFVLSSKFSKVDNTSGANFAFRKELYLQINGFVDSWTIIAEDVEIGRRLKKYGKLALLPFNFSYTSARRFQENGYVKSAFMFLKEWIHFKHRKENVKIEDYWNK